MFEMTYNTTQLQAADTIFKLVVYGNDSTSGLLMALFLLAAFFIMLMALKRYEFGKALMTSSAITFVVSLFLVYAGLIGTIWALVFFILMAGSVFLSQLFD